MAMKEFTPSMPYTVAIELLKPTMATVKGVPTKTFPSTGIHLNCSFKTYGGTETTENDLYSVIDTANVETWYRPDITSDCRIKVLETGCEYEIIGKPENIDMRHQFMRFKVRAIEGGV